MLRKLFKRNETNKVVVAPISLKLKTTNEIIEEIHETFYTEVDRLLADAKILKSTATNKQDLIDKYAQLEKLGFAQTKECIEGYEEVCRLNKIEVENANRDTLVKAIDYFSVKYPNYKFITEDSVKKICEKYNLIYGQVGLYKGTVPDKNLQHMKDFKIDKTDACYKRENSRWFSINSNDSTPVSYKTYAKHTSIPITDGMTEVEQLEEYHRRQMMNSMMDYSYSKCKLEIAAPIKDFDTTNMKVENFKLSKIEIPDPVVLQPVFFEGQKHFLIVTAWGLEASDELIVNQKMN